MAITKETILDVIMPVAGTTEVVEHRGNLTIILGKQHLVATALELRDNTRTQFNQLLDVTAVDWYDRKKPRFDVVYNLYSLPNSSRLFLKVGVEEEFPSCPTLTGIWESANWYERETYDMYGVIFSGHPDLRRFYMPEDFVDPESGEPLYPLRKDFPVMGIPGSLPMPEKYPTHN
jgi:NADH-quinone oxidoreductase subunit C